MPLTDALLCGAGARPRTTPTNPHTRLDQQRASTRVIEQRARRAFPLRGVAPHPADISKAVSTAARQTSKLQRPAR